MKFLLVHVIVVVSMLICRQVGATQADDTTITITGQTPGATPFINQLSLISTNVAVIKSIQFSIAPKMGSVIRPLSVSYSGAYLLERGYLQPTTGEIFLPVYGLYSSYNNTVTLTYNFQDGSSKQTSTTIATASFTDPCGYTAPTVLQARTDSTALSYDYMLVKGSCSDFSPAIIDTDGSLRWVGTSGVATYTGTFFDNAVYIPETVNLLRMDLDGAVTTLPRYDSIGVTFIHHNIDRGKVGIIMDVDTTSYLESVNIEVDAAGNVLKTWNLADIISAAMRAGGDDPSQFVYPTPTDWFHNNGVAYNRADDSLIVSSRENFLICIDYETGAIKWILGDPTKKWHQFPSLAKYALTLTAGSLPPIGQHAPYVTYDQGVLVFDNGAASGFQVPAGDARLYSSPRKYQIDLNAKTATEVWNYEQNQTVYSPFCGSSYEDAPLNYLVDYALVNGANVPNSYAQLLGLDAAGETVFYYQYPADRCGTAFNSLPLHLEETKFPTVEPQALNLSTRGLVSADENTLIGGFIVTGTDSITVVLRALGPSLTNAGLGGTIGDPVLTLYNSSGTPIAMNDNWAYDPGATQIKADGLAPTSPAESAILATLAPGAYTFVFAGKDPAPGVGLLEAYNVSAPSAGTLANISARGFVGENDEVLISGFIVGDVANDAVIVRALGPSLSAQHVEGVLSDPALTVYDSNGSAIGGNGDWQEDPHAAEIVKDGLAPVSNAESATVLNLPAGAYSAIVSGAGATTGVGLVEVYSLD